MSLQWLGWGEHWVSGKDPTTTVVAMTGTEGAVQVQGVV